MQRKILVNLHLLFASLFAPLIILMSLSGGLYLFGYKGSYDKEFVVFVPQVQLDKNSKTLDQEARALFEQYQIEVDFEYLKAKSSGFYTRPTHRQYYQLNHFDGGTGIVRVQPDFIGSIVELHKGHGPWAFKWFEKILALVLIMVLLSGIWLGLKRKDLRIKTLAAFGAGSLLLVLLAAV